MWDRVLDKISGPLAFFPPDPPCYDLEPSPGEDGTFRLHPTMRGLRPVPHAQVTLLPLRPVAKAGASASGAPPSLAVLWLPAPHPTRRTVMHCHGNAVDLGGQLPCLSMLSRALGCNVVAWDYRGYGCSGGIPRASKLASDAAAVLAHVKRSRGLEDGDVLLYGQSLGSAPACALGAVRAGLAGVVLHSALLSGMRTLSPSVRWWPRWADVAVNDALVPKIAAPLLVLHGTADRVVPWEHGCALAALARTPAETLWAQGRGHDDVEADKRYLDTLVRFAERCWGGKR